MYDYALRACAFVGVIAFAITLLAVMFAGDFLHESAGLPWRSIGVFVTLFVTGMIVATLWSTTLRQWSRRPNGSNSRKNDKQRS